MAEEIPFPIGRSGVVPFLPPNTLTNADGTPYSAGKDDTSQEKLREALKILEAEMPSVSNTCCERLEQVCCLLEDVLLTILNNTSSQ